MHILKQVMDGIGVIVKPILVVPALIANGLGCCVAKHRADPLLVHCSMVFSELRQGSDSPSFSSRRRRNSFLASVFPKRLQFSLFLLGQLQPQGLSYGAWPQSYDGLSSTLHLSWHE